MGIRKIERKDMNAAIVAAGNLVAIRRDENGNITQDNFMAYWESFWNGLQHERLTFIAAVDQATQHAISGVNRDDRMVFFTRTGINGGCTTALNDLIDHAANQALVDPARGHDRYMEGWEAFWHELRHGASPEQAIKQAITPERSVSYQACTMAVGEFIKRYRQMGKSGSTSKVSTDVISIDDIRDSSKHRGAKIIDQLGTKGALLYANRVSGPHGNLA